MKLSPDLIKHAIEVRAAGTSIAALCRKFGINQTSWHNWLKQGRQDIASEKDSLHAQLVLGLDEAIGNSEYQSLKVIKNSRDWKAHSWFLERLNPAIWADKNVLEREVMTLFKELMKSIESNLTDSAKTELKSALEKNGLIFSPNFVAETNNKEDEEDEEPDINDFL